MFLFKKKREEPAVAPGEMTGSESCTVKVLGSGCSKCNALEAAVKEALTRLGREPAVEHVTDFARIAAYGVMQTPALVIGEQVVSYGKVLKPEEAEALLREHLAD